MTATTTRAPRRRLTDQDRMLRAIPEAAFQVRVIETAKLYGWLVHAERAALRQSGKVSTPIQGAPGFLDLVMARRGRVIFSELKTELGQTTAFQDRWIEELVATDDRSGGQGLEVYLWRPSDYDGEICEVLR